MSEKNYNSKTRSSSDGELIDMMDDVDVNESDEERARTFTLPRPTKKKFKHLKEQQNYNNNNYSKVEEENNEDVSKRKKKGFHKPSMKSVGNFMHKVFRHMSFSLVPGPGGGGRHPSLYRHRKSMSASTTDVRSHTNNRNDLPRVKTTPGVTGLRNHGNTCFMNSVLQCICHTDILAEYFVMDQYKIDLTRRNKTNSKKFGTRGEVTEQLALLLKSLWSCQYTPEISNQFKTVVGKYESQYLGSNQHDAQEFLLWLLDKVHEDLNTATKKKYKKSKGGHGRPEESVAAEAIANHTRCNSSFVHDLFQALYRSSLTCPKCQSRSITFDPFLCVSIPIPQRQMSPVYITMVYLNQQPKQVKLGLNVNSQANIRELREMLESDTRVSESRLVLTELVPEGFHHTFGDSQPVSIIRESDNVYAMEVPSLRPVNAREGEHLLLVWVNRLGIGSQGKRFGCPYVQEVPREATYQELEKAILTTMSGILKEGALDQVKHGPIARLRVVDGLPGKFYLPYDVDHPLYMPTVDKALSLWDEERGPKHLKLIIEWDLETRNEMVESIDDVVEEHLSVKQLKNQQTQPATATLSECFKLYTQEEKLGPEDPWMCPSCKQLRQGVKRLGLWTVPDILVIHLKRFRQTSSQRIKLNTLVEFPITELDMSPHIVGQNCNNHHVHTNGFGPMNYWSPWRRHRSRFSRNGDNLYDLYAVCNHQGNMQGGHYTAYCRNPTDGNWYSFDDTKVQKLQTDSEIVTPNAYILFYQKTSLAHSGTSSSASSSSSGSSDHWAYRMPNFNYAPPKFSKSQDNLVGIDSHEDDGFTKPIHQSAFTRGIRPYNSMAPLSSHKKKPDQAVIAEPDHYSDDEQYNKMYITESCV